MQSYLKGVWGARYFILYLAIAELKYKFRRSKLGLLWTMITPLVLSLIMTFVLGTVLKMDMRDYGPYIYSGTLVWEFINSSVALGCTTLLISEPYIKQYRQPFAIYALKTVLVSILSFAIAVCGLLIWIVFYKPANLIISIFVLPISIVCLLIVGWPIAGLAAFTNLKYRDFGQITTLGMQLLWYVSPVFFQPSMFSSGILSVIFMINPITHILNLIRAPLLYGSFPSLIDFSFVIGTAAVLYLIFALRIHYSEKTLIYYF